MYREIPNVCDNIIVGLGKRSNEYLRLRLKSTMESLRCMCLDRNAIVKKMPNDHYEQMLYPKGLILERINFIPDPINIDEKASSKLKLQG